MSRHVQAGALVVLGLLPFGCGTAVPTDETRLAAYTSGDRSVGAVRLAKPVDDPGLDPAFLLAPLIVNEVGADGAAAPFGAVGSDGRPTGDAGEPAVYVVRSSADVGGSARARWTYAWWHAPDTLRGIRMTLDAEGFPAVYEILGDSDGLRRLFVLRELDEAAAAAFGSPLPGRSFAIERSVADAPRVVVLDTIEPGPTPLGPFVYFAADRHDAFALHCRCSPSLMAEVVENVEYRLVRLDALPVDWDVDTLPLESSLRLPSGAP